MGKYIAKKILTALLVLLGVSILTFAMGRLAPGNPVETLLSSKPNPTTEEIAEAEEYLGLDRPWAEQYLQWAGRLLKGDFGISYKTGRPIREELAVRLPATLQLALGAFAVMLLIGFPMGILSALYQNRILDVGIRLFQVITISVPTFCIGILLILVFGVKLRWFPVYGSGTWRHLVMPALAIGLSSGAGLARLIRTRMLKILQKDFVMAARVFGVPERKVIANQVLKNALPPVITSIGLMLGALLGGSAIIETLFSWPGAGSYAIEAIYGRDYPVIQIYALIMAAIYLVMNSLIEIFCGAMMPFAREEGGRNEA